MSKRTLRIWASVLIIVALALLVIGLSNETALLWGLGLLVLAVAMGMSLATRWAGSGPE